MQWSVQHKHRHHHKTMMSYGGTTANSKKTVSLSSLITILTAITFIIFDFKQVDNLNYHLQSSPRKKKKTYIKTSVHPSSVMSGSPCLTASPAANFRMAPRIFPPSKMTQSTSNSSRRALQRKDPKVVLCCEPMGWDGMDLAKWFIIFHKVTDRFPWNN